MVILVLTGLPGSCFTPPKHPWGQDKIAHVLMYLAFAYITLWGYRKPYSERGKAFHRNAILITLGIGIVFGALTEVMQATLIPGRIGSYNDWIADCVGTVFGIFLFYFLHRKGNNLQNESFCK